ncbi:uncharacterized protein LOC115921081 [Strongylocentrotus purpuratus]|uniref:Uncharacterized protein n=1 Tax=Strongylocentrotus purpuratus TaxID=7668 RepID=A0A7M7NEY5_STRPU|nr:uncharacterized protein LOC115921081 [Strongylocentrotus purpuratus]
MRTSFNQTTLSPSPNGGLAKFVVPVIVVIALLAAISICVAIIICWCRRKQLRNQKKDNQESIPLHPDRHINVPEHLLKAISPQEVEGFVYRLTGRHCKRLAKAVGITDQEVITTIIHDNNDDLFDTQSMIIDWVDGQECSNFEKRCRLDDAVIKIGRHDMTDSFGTTIYRVETGGTVQRPHPDAKKFNSTTIFDDDLQALLKHLPTCAVSVFLERLGISVDEDREDIEEKLRGWRDDNLRGPKARSMKELVLIHKDVLNKTNNSNVLDLKDEELKDVFASISSSKQMDQLKSRLRKEIREESFTLQHLKEWRDSQDMGNRRETLRKMLHDIKLSGCIVNRRPPQHVYKAEMVRLAFSLLCNDVGPLAALLNMDTCNGKIVRESQKGTVGLLLQLLNKSKDIDTHIRRDLCVAIRSLGYLDVARLAYFDYDESLSVLSNVTSKLSQQEMEMLMKHLDSEKADKAVLSIGRARQQSAGTYDNLMLMKRWRDQFRPEPFHHSSKLVHGLRAIGRTGLAEEVLGGLYKHMQMSGAVAIHICNSLEDDQLQRLYVHLGLRTTKRQEDRTTTSTAVVEWMQNCVKHFDKIPTLNKMVKNKFDFRKHENNELFKAGFSELAEEIMLLQYPRFPRIV